MTINRLRLRRGLSRGVFAGSNAGFNVLIWIRPGYSDWYLLFDSEIHHVDADFEVGLVLVVLDDVNRRDEFQPAQQMVRRRVMRMSA